MHRPRLLIMDEPTSGLDPLNQQEFYHLLAEAKASGSTAFLSSHNLAEVEHTCDRVGIIREGQLANVDAVHTLKDIQHHEVELTFSSTATASADWFIGLPGVREVSVNNGGPRPRPRGVVGIRGELPAGSEQRAVNRRALRPPLP